ncbi:MAG TPA: hypothetical protein VNM87_10400, partial [Candidatus Udaeobacter sp.]|nr:hypothetical protein [Candidatus Udaeobacter sp.]
TQNELAVEADRTYRAAAGQQGFYRIYMAHNHHFLSWACQMSGRSEEALRAAREMIAGVPPDFLEEMAFFADGYMNIEMETLMRFGRWEDILKLSPPPDYLPITNAMLQVSRGVAYAALGQVDSAKSAQAGFETACTRVTEDMIVGNNPAQTVLGIARHLLAGEILAREGNIDEAVAELQKGVDLEDTLRYNEAPDWLQPVRHALGAVLVRAERYRQAEQVYRDDLTRNRENGWALNGLALCLRKQKKIQDAEEVETRFREAWAKADVKIMTSCFCQAI